MQDASNQPSQTTETKPDVKTTDLNTAEIVRLDYDKHVAEVFCPKVGTKFTVYKPRNNTPFYKIMSPYVVPNFLAGDFRSLDKAVEFIFLYNKNAKESDKVRQEILHKERQERNAARSNQKAN